MNDTNHSFELKRLSSDYYHSHISFVEYRAQRKIILDKIDKDLNGVLAVNHSNSDVDDNPAFLETVSYLNNTEIKP